ncbi:SlyX family protein [Azospirillum sp.]|uniref:SlyX family protein n=1 Tax=Azospirillum sp. TaxID=34012 RepID=UPI002D3265E0|nr:SlyX family protein [Azospirillum sp.]HYD68935.1 SlyX family protein [Azospirillum sp.]
MADAAQDPSLECRLIDLETRLAHHERMAEELSTVMFEQGRTIDLLTAQVRRLRERLADLEAGVERSPQDDRPPPHY